MEFATSGDRVTVHFTGTLEDGMVFDSSVGREPLELVLGKGHVVPGLEAAILGMKKGEKKSATVPPEQAYGSPREELIFNLERSQIPSDVSVEVGEKLALRSPDNREFPVAVTGISDEFITLDANHPLAGKTLVFEIELIDIEPGEAPQIH